MSAKTRFNPLEILQASSTRTLSKQELQLVLKFLAQNTKNIKNKQMAPKIVRTVANKAKQAAIRAAKKEGKKLLKKNAGKIAMLAASGATAVGGPAAGAAVGGMAYQGALKIAGDGDYTVTSNTLASTGGVVDTVPKFVTHGRGTRVVHCEYIGDVISSATANTFENTSYVVNPANPLTFPWLNAIAGQYDQWKPNGMVFAFKSTSSSYSGSTQALGGVVLASDYDVIDAPYSSKVEMENSQFAVSCKSDMHILHPMECNPKERQVELLKCRGIATPSDNLQWYDLANFQVATFGVPDASVNLGELWVTYDITFYKEQVYAGLKGASINFYRTNGTTGISTSDYFGTELEDADNTMELTLTGTTVNFPASIPLGNYLLSYSVSGDSTAYVAPTLTLTDGASSYLPVFYGTNPSATGTTLTANVAFRITAPGATITFSGGTLPANPTAASLLVTQLNPNSAI